MSGLEGLGAIAAVAQLLSYAIGISSGLSDLRARIRGGPDRLRQYERHLKELDVITAHIKQNKALQTDEVKTCLTAIVAHTEAAKNILAKFRQSPRARQQWAIMNDALTRKLGGPLGDVQKSAANLNLLVASLTAQGLQVGRVELAVTSAGGVPSSAQATTILAGASQDITDTPESVDRRTGSHSFNGIKMKNNRLVTLGNTSNENPHAGPNGTEPRMAGHSYKDMTMTGNIFVHLGNTGGASEGHRFEGGEVEDNDETSCGDYTSVAEKREHIALARGMGRNADSSFQ